MAKVQRRRSHCVCCRISSTKDTAWYLRNGLRLARMNISVDRVELRLHRSTRVEVSCVEIWKSRWASARIRQGANWKG
eukprot:5130922-Pyramimonas_sp.AAC.1